MVLADHLRRQLDEREADALVIRPLPAQHRGKAQEDGEHRHDRDQPVEQRHDPHTPGHRLAFTETLEEGDHRPLLGAAAGVPGHKPRGDVAEEHLLPLIPGIGEVVDSDERRNQVFHEPPR